MKKKEKALTEFDLLSLFVDEMVRQGVSKNLVHMNIDDEMAAKASAKAGRDIVTEDLKRLADKCFAAEWLQHSTISERYSYLQLTSTGLGVVRSRQAKQERLSNRTIFKKASDFIEDHKGLIAALSFLLALAGAITTILYKTSK